MIRLAPTCLALLALSPGCIRDAPLPDLGACAEYPEGVYEYGQVGIGTCLGGPADMAFLDDGHTLAISNANPWVDFTGGSLLLVDLDNVDTSAAENPMDEVGAHALALPSFNGQMAYLPELDRVVVTNRNSEGTRTREETDSLYFIDVSDPTAPRLDDALGPDGGALGVGYDPNAVTLDPLSGYLFVANATSHEVAMVDVSQAPATIVPPGGPGRLLPHAWNDVDGSGSRAAFVKLETTEGTTLDAHDWTMFWNVGTVRGWIPTEGGARRVTSNGEGAWEESAVPRDLDTTNNDLITEIVDPWFLWGYDPDAGVAIGRMLFLNQGSIWDAQATDLVEWVGRKEPLLTPDPDVGEAELGGPSLVATTSGFELFYDAGDAGAHGIHHASSAIEDGIVYERLGAVLTPPEGVSYEDPFVLADVSSHQWRMWFTVVSGDDWSIGEAVSDDLITWTELPDRYTRDHDAASPAVGYWGGRFHLYTVGHEYPLRAREAVSLDGTHWEDTGASILMDLSGGSRARLALQVAPEDSFSLVDETGTTLPLAVQPGSLIQNGESGWAVDVAAGQWLGPEDIGALAAHGVRLDSVVATDTVGSGRMYLTLTDDEDVERIGTATYDALTGQVRVTLQPLLEPGDGGSATVDGVGSPIVVSAGSGYVMYFAGSAAGVTTIHRATSSDGLVWTVEAGAVLSPEADWEQVGVEPSSVEVLGDGSIRLYYTGNDGARWRVGVAEGSLTGALTRVPSADSLWTFDAGTPGDWDDSGVRRASVWREGDTEHMWYAGYSGTSWQIGYAQRTDDGEWARNVDIDDTSQPVLGYGPGSFGADGVDRPVVTPGVDGRSDGWTLWYTGEDLGIGRVGRAVTQDPNRVWRDLRLPTLADTWGFLSIPENDGEAISLDLTVEESLISGRGCTGLAADPDRGFLYVSCQASRFIYALDVRDDSTDDFRDLNYLGVEAILTLEATTSSTTTDHGWRMALVDNTRGWLWGLADAPDSVEAIDLASVVDDADTELVRQAVVAVLPLPRGSRAAGADTVSDVGPGQMALHPDGEHLFITNFNDNSVSCYDLSQGAPAVLVAEARNVGENPYSVRISPDGRWAAVGNYAGTVEDGAASSTIALLDADPTSPDFMTVRTLLVNK